MIRKIVEKLFWYYQEKDNWKMKMNEPIAIRKLTKEEAEKILSERREKKKTKSKEPVVKELVRFSVHLQNRREGIALCVIAVKSHASSVSQSCEVLRLSSPGVLSEEFTRIHKMFTAALQSHHRYFINLR